MIYGIFNDEGLLEGDFASLKEAQDVAEEYDDEDDVHVAECCPDHPKEERATCEACDEEEEDETDGDEEEEDDE